VQTSFFTSLILKYASTSFVVCLPLLGAAPFDPAHAGENEKPEYQHSVILPIQSFEWFIIDFPRHFDKCSDIEKENEKL
jgi:hypothetical protein